MFKKLIQGKLICSYCHKSQVDKKIVPNNLVRNFEVQLKQIQNSCQSQIQNEILGARKHEIMLLCLCTALIMIQYLGSIICSKNKIDPKIFLHRIHKYLVNPRQKDKKIVPNNLVRNFEMQLKQIQNSSAVQKCQEFFSTSKVDPTKLF